MCRKQLPSNGQSKRSRESHLPLTGAQRSIMTSHANDTPSIALHYAQELPARALNAFGYRSLGGKVQGTVGFRRQLALLAESDRWCKLTFGSCCLNSGSSSSASKYTSVEVMEIVPGTTTPGAISLPSVLYEACSKRINN